MGTENVETISKWALATFGPRASIRSISYRALTECAELLGLLAFEDPDWDAVAEEAADVAIVLARVASEGGITAAKAREYLALELQYLSHCPDLLIARRMAGNLAKTVVALADTENNPTGLRCLYADAVGLCTRLCEPSGVSLDEWVDRKMRINRAREWRLDGRGHGQHVAGTGLPSVPA